AGLSDRGLRRANNQDSYAAVPAASDSYWRRRGHLFVIADGMGAHAAGEMASRMAAELIPFTYGKLGERSPPEALCAAITEANRQIYTRGNANRDFHGMGTTTSALLILPEGAVIGHVGDSRIYRLRGDHFEQLTSDHSLAWEVRAAGEQAQAFVSEKFPNGVPKNIITRSLGPAPDVQVDLEGPIPIQPGDTFLLCTDGLSGPMEDPELATILSLFPPEEAAHILVDTANLRGGPDNITLLIVRVNDPTMRSAARMSRSSAGPERTVSPDRSGVPATKSGGLTNGTAGGITDGLTNGTESGTERSEAIDPQRIFMIGVLMVSLFAGPVTGLVVPQYRIVTGLLTTSVTALFGVVAGMVLKRHLASEPPPPPWYLTRRGSGPYVRTQVRYDPEFTQKLARLTLQLREASETSGWEIDSVPFRNHYEQAVTASNVGDYRIAIRELCLAMRLLMEQLRTGPDSEVRAPGDRESTPEGKSP
ncbi:MAG: protein phosphatase 2C domain-containing protein, partial [Planctomycetia bacterium]|nr:protein phosphatase 2C domain-containing protein [Planctomycetia bacterium]